jgi:hypothetical protein
MSRKSSWARMGPILKLVGDHDDFSAAHWHSIVPSYYKKKKSNLCLGTNIEEITKWK